MEGKALQKLVEKSTVPLVSIIIPMFNSAQTIERCLSSTVNQGVDTEIIVIDDHSEDSSVDVVTQLKNEYNFNLKLERTPMNLGASGARNVGIELAKGKYVAFLDADDLWLENKLAEQIRVIESDSTVQLVSCDSLKITPQGRVKARNHEYHPPSTGHEAWKTLLKYNFLPTPTVLCRTEIVRRVGGFNTDLPIAEDLDLWIRIAKLGSIEVIPRVLVHYFDSAGSLMKRGGIDHLKLVYHVVSTHLDDERLSKVEKDFLLATRYYGTAIGYSAISKDKMDQNFKNAIAMGFPRSKILKYKTKLIIKRSIRQTFRKIQTLPFIKRC